MVDRMKKTKICDKVSHEEDMISQLPDDLICDILYHLSTKDAIRTSLLSTRWRNLWRWVPGLDLSSYTFSNYDAFVSFGERFLDSHKESWIRKLRLMFNYRDGMCDPTSWIDAVTMRRIQHLDVHGFWLDKIPLSLYTCETLVHLRLYGAALAFAELVSLPCLKIMHLEDLRDTDETTLERLISGSPVLEDLKLIRCPHPPMLIQVRSHRVKRIEIDFYAEVVIDAPLLQCLRTKIYLTRNFEIINSGFPAKLDIDLRYPSLRFPKKVILDIITDILRVRDLAVDSNILKEICLLKPASSLHFSNLSHLNARFFMSDLELLPTVLESCPKLESLILEVAKNSFLTYELNIEQKVVFSTVPRCLASSLKFVEFKRSIPYEGEIELVRYFLKNSTVLEKLRFNTHNNKKAKCAFLTELVAMTRCSSACEVLVL